MKTVYERTGRLQTTRWSFEKELVQVWDKILGQSLSEVPSGQRKAPHLRGFCEAAEGTRTLDLLHGKQTL
jgi:hypothetical protein